jgi:hypothetical protein
MNRPEPVEESIANQSNAGPLGPFRSFTWATMKYWRGASPRRIFASS